MDANGQRFWQLADAAQWRGRSHVRWDAECRVLQLASERSLAPAADPTAAHAAANSALERVPRALDADGVLAWWDAAQGAIVVRSHLPEDAIVLSLPQAPSDLAVCSDGVLVMVIDGALRLHDLRGRWADVGVAAPSFTGWRLAADADGGCWVLERSSGRLARLSGRPLPLDGARPYAPTVFRPTPENCAPPTLSVLPAPVLDDGERVVALDVAADGTLWLLSWVGASAQGRLRRVDASTGQVEAALRPLGAASAYALAVLPDGRCALRLPGRTEAPVFDPANADAQRRVPASGEVFPLPADALEAPFVHRLGGPAQLPLALDATPGVQPLLPLSVVHRARSGEARHYDDDGAQLLDSGAADTVWHRLAMEARLPPRCGAIAWLAASDLPQPPPAEDPAWTAHRFGDAPGDGRAHWAAASWDPAPSELPHHPGFAPWPSTPGVAGLWTVLIQDPRRRVRRLVGRYLWVRLSLHGDGRQGPEVAALRAWSSRFSYRDRYLPRLFRESIHGAPAALPGPTLGDIGLAHVAVLDAGGAPDATLRDALSELELDLGASARIVVQTPGRRWQLVSGPQRWQLQTGDGAIDVYRPQATPADFLERLLCNFEGLLTPIEDRIAQAHLLSDPDSAPEESLGWVGNWIGVAFDPALPEDRRREWLRQAPALARTHGTRRGLELALDVASGGGVRGGEIVVLEDFRMRRVLATLLGVDLNDATDPLLPGLVLSGNSVVGDTLTLGDAESDELLALYRADAATAAENDAVLDFLDALANRATVFVHDTVQPQDLGLLRRIVALEAPAHVEVRIVTASWPFLVGIAGMVGVESYLRAPRSARPAVLDDAVGGRDFVLGRASLDPRLSGAPAAPVTPPPTADAGADFSTPYGASFSLDGSGSQAAPGRRIDQYRWRLLPPE